MLHIFTLGHDSSEQLSRCLSLMGSQDALILTEDGVVWAHNCEASARLLDEFSASGERQIAVLASDLAARGLKHDSNAKQSVFNPIDMTGFVKLTEHHSQSLTWY